jgi:hypothetical protein
MLPGGTRLPNTMRRSESLAGLIKDCCSPAKDSKKLASRSRTNGRSSPSIHNTGSALSLPWSCQVQGGVRIKSPGPIKH